MLTSVLQTTAGKRASLCLVLAGGIKTVRRVEVFQTLCPGFLCNAHAGKYLLLIHVFNEHKVQKMKCVQTMGVQYVTSPLLPKCKLSAHRQRRAKDALEMFRYFGRIGPENDSLSLCLCYMRGNIGDWVLVALMGGEDLSSISCQFFFLYSLNWII